MGELIQMSLTNNNIEPTPTIQNILLTQSKIPNYSKIVPEVDNSKESIKLRKLETKLGNNLLAIIKYIIKKEALSNTPYQKPRLADLKRKYGFLFASILRSAIEEVYRLGGTYALKFDEIPSLGYFTTDSDLVLIRKYTTQYHNRIWFRIDKFMLNRVPEAPPIKGSFVVNTLAAEICTFVMMEATKEKTRQILTILDKNNPNASLTIESASAVDSDNVVISGSSAASSDLKTKSESASSPFGIEAITELLRIRGYTDLLEDSSFSIDLDPSVIDTEFLSTQLREKYYFVWATARDDKVCKKYCRPLEGVFWKLGDLNLIPQPDLLTHPFCRCRILRVRF